MSNELMDKVAIVTGGAGGIGRGIVELFVEEGARVVIGDVDTGAGEELAAMLGDRVRFLRTDVSEKEDVQALVDFSLAEFGDLHVMQRGNIRCFPQPLPR